jgi:hypothetical protein
MALPIISACSWIWAFSSREQGFFRRCGGDHRAVTAHLCDWMISKGSREITGLVIVHD